MGRWARAICGLCYANSLERITRAVERIGEALEKLDRRPAREKVPARR